MNGRVASCRAVYSPTSDDNHTHTRTYMLAYPLSLAQTPYVLLRNWWMFFQEYNNALHLQCALSR